MIKQYSMFQFNRHDRTNYFNTKNIYFKQKQNQAVKIMFSLDALINTKIKLKFNLR